MKHEFLIMCNSYCEYKVTSVHTSTTEVFANQKTICVKLVAIEIFVKEFAQGSVDTLTTSAAM